MSNETAKACALALQTPGSVLTALLLDGNDIDYAHFQQLQELCNANKRRLVAPTSRSGSSTSAGGVGAVVVVGGGGLLGRQYRLLSSLRRAKATFTDVLVQKDQASTAVRRSGEYLASLQTGRKGWMSSEVRLTDDLVSQLTKLKLDTLEIQSQFRSLAQQLAAEESKWDGKVNHVQTQLESEKGEMRHLRKKIAKETANLAAKKGSFSSIAGSFSDVASSSSSSAISAAAAGAGS